MTPTYYLVVVMVAELRSRKNTKKCENNFCLFYSLQPFAEHLRWYRTRICQPKNRKHARLCLEDLLFQIPLKIEIEQNSTVSEILGNGRKIETFNYGYA